MASRAELAWLACFLDSEGSICASGTSIHCNFANSDPSMLDTAQRILTKLGVHYSVFKKHKINRQVFDVKVIRRKDLIKLFTVLEPYLLRLDKKAKLVLRYYTRRSHRIKYNAKRTPIEMRILDAVRVA